MACGREGTEHITGEALLSHNKQLSSIWSSLHYNLSLHHTRINYTKLPPKHMD